MAQIRHKQAAQELRHSAGVAKYWLASEHNVKTDPGGGKWVEAAPNAKWQRFSPFDTYSQHRGPHHDFLSLKSPCLEWPDEHRKEIEKFADRYGLLGLFHDRYSAPVLPPGKQYVAPEAVIRKSGKLELLNPKTEGFALLEDLLRREYDAPDLRLSWDEVELPSRLTVALKHHRPGGRLDPAGFEPYPEQVTWEEARGAYGALIVADMNTAPRVVVLSTREQAEAWYFAVPDISEPEVLASQLNWNLVGVSPHAYLTDDGEWERGWRCPSLLQAIRLMIYLDLTGSTDIKPCKSQGCPEYFSVNKRNKKKKYCSERCANRASSRMSRGQAP